MTESWVSIPAFRMNGKPILRTTMWRAFDPKTLPTPIAGSKKKSLWCRRAAVIVVGMGNGNGDGDGYRKNESARGCEMAW